jgi:hypothetical protein
MQVIENVNIYCRTFRLQFIPISFKGVLGYLIHQYFELIANIKFLFLLIIVYYLKQTASCY